MGYTINDVLTLARAGFTASQIAAMTAVVRTALPAAPATLVPTVPAAPATPVPTVPAAPATPVPTVPAAPATPVPTAPAAPATPADPLEQILTQLRLNALNAVQQPPTQSVDDILAEIINPPAAGK